MWKAACKTLLKFYVYAHLFTASTLFTYVKPVQGYDCAHVKIMWQSKRNYKPNEKHNYPFLLFMPRVMLAFSFVKL